MGEGGRQQLLLEEASAAEEQLLCCLVYPPRHFRPEAASAHVFVTEMTYCKRKLL